ncbi:hypothetical protein MAR_005241 [Mya arenaria]|uniref:Uncharacterized protein n=1 Tax=Mya arenaria TaxID=6604 RepID=A0ABY7F262_MYAAR|nr:hypothetical protein MAR_005241 [Mya arenaria]
MSFRAVKTSDMQYNAIIRAHALQVLGAVNKCNRDKLRELMKEFGIQHKNYSVKLNSVILFDTHLDVHDDFMSFRAVKTSDMQYNGIIRAHALQVLGTVNKCNRDKLRELMKEFNTRIIP